MTAAIGANSEGNERRTQFNVALALCAGHDSLFYEHSDAPACDFP